MSYNYVVTAHKPTVVSHSLVGNFTGPNDLNLILCKSTRIEIFSVTPEGLQPLLDVGIYGNIATASLFRNRGEKQDLLFLSTNKYKFCVLAYDPNQGMVTRANGDIRDRIIRAADIGQIGIIDPECRMIGLHISEGNFKVIPINDKGQLQEAYNLPLEVSQVIDIKFLHGCARPTIAVLYQDSNDRRHVKTYEVTSKLGDGPWAVPEAEDHAITLIALPKPYYGLIIIGDQSIAYHNGTNFISLAMKSTVMKAYGFLEPNGSRILLGDYMGRIYCLILMSSTTTTTTTTGGDDKVTGLQLELLGETSSPSTLSYLGNGFVFVGSTSGDSQLIRLETEKDADTGQCLRILENFTNLGAIVDFCVVDLERQGQGQVVTCSGSYRDGSLRVIGNGVNVNVFAQHELPGIKGLWSLSPPKGSKYEKYLAVSFVGETRVLAMAGEELDETEISGFLLDQQTLFCGNVIDQQYIQITSKGIFLIESASEQLVSSWVPPDDGRINVCSCNTSQIAIATKGRELLILQIAEKALNVVGNKTMPYDIACISIDPVGPSSPLASMCAVGLWTDISITILALPSLEEIRRVEIGGEIIPRSLMFKTFDNVTYLFIALGDGHLITYTYDLKTGELENKKKVSVGTRPVTLNQFKTNDTTHVFATSDRPVVMHHSPDRKLLYANVNLKEVNHMCDFDCSSFPSALALATEDSLTIGSLDAIQQLHIRTIQLGEMPRRICHQEQSKHYCLLTLKTEFNQKGEEIETYCVKLIDDQTFEVKDNYLLNVNETACSVISTKLGHETAEYFIVGTAYVIPEELEPLKGRILAFSVRDSKLKLQTEKEVQGAVYCLASLRGKILAGINSTIQLFKWKVEEGINQLALECEHKGNVIVWHLVSRGDFIVVADIMKSISLLIYSPTECSIKYIAREYSPYWMTAATILDDDNYIGAENSHNIFTVTKNSAAVTQEDRGRLGISGQFHLGELVNKFRHGSLVMKMQDDGLEIGTTLLYGGVSGSLGVIATISASIYNYLLKIQNSLTKVVRSVGGFDHAEWREFAVDNKNASALGFIDGDLVESFLELSPPLMATVAEDVGVPVDELTKEIEKIAKAFH